MTSRTNALTAIAPLRPGRLWWCRLLLPMLRMVAMSSSLARLRFIHYGGWIVFGGLRERIRHPALSLWRHRPTMLFQSDYDGDPREYLAAFCLAVAKGMRFSFGPAAGFPGTKPTRSFIEYVERHRWTEQLRYTAYPGATVKDLDTALQVSDRLERIATLPGGPDAGLEDEYRALLRVLSLAPEPPPAPSWLAALRARSSVSGLTVLMPIEPTRRASAVAQLTRLGQLPEAVFGPVGGVHFARLVTLQIPTRRWWWAPAPEGEPGHLLLSAWVDGTGDDFARRLVDSLDDRADDIWGGCTGYPGTDDPERLADWILAHQLPFRLFLGSRSGVSAERAQAALELADQVAETVLATCGKPLPEVHQALRDLYDEGGAG